MKKEKEKENFSKVEVLPHLIEYLEGPVEVDLHPARRLLDRLPVVVGAPALHEGQPGPGAVKDNIPDLKTKIKSPRSEQRQEPRQEPR